MPPIAASNWIHKKPPLRGDPLLFPTRVSAPRPSLGLATAALARSSVVSYCDAAGGRPGAGQSILGGAAPRAADATTGEVVPMPRLVGRASSASPCQPGKHLGDW
jgi:hypothetical protein